MPDQPTPDDPIVDHHVRPFADWLREQSSGRTHEELGDGLHDLIARVQDTGKKGQLILTVTVAPLKEDGYVLTVSDEIRLKLPEHDRDASIFYPDEHGNLTRRDPRHLPFEGPVREVPAQHVDPDQIREAH